MSKLYDIMWKKETYKSKRKITEEEIKAVHDLGLSVAQAYFCKNLEDVISSKKVVNKSIIQQLQI